MGQWRACHAGASRLIRIEDYVHYLKEKEGREAVNSEVYNNGRKGNISWMSTVMAKEEKK